MTLLAGQRRQKIVERLAETQVARVADLARVFNVTEETIRRDLEKLEREGRLIRIHGGAMPIADLTRDTPFDVRRGANHSAKEQIAQRALVHIQEGAVIGLDASSSAHELACRLPDMPLTVITNSFPATAELWKRRHARVVSTGGVLDRSSRSWIGSFAEQALQRVNISLLFLSSKGVDLVRGLSEVDDAQARLKRRMIELAEHVILLADHSKFGVRAAVSFAELHDVQTVITDSETRRATIDALREMGLEVEIAS